MYVLENGTIMLMMIECYKMIYTIDGRLIIHGCGKMLTLLHLECTFGLTTLKITH